MRLSRTSLSLLLPIPFLLQACAPLFTDGFEEVRHRYHAVYSDDAKKIVVMDESHLWDCSGTMARCYDRRTNFNLAIYTVDVADTAKKDTLVRPHPASGGIESSWEGILFHSGHKDRMIYYQIDTVDGKYHLYLTNAKGKEEFDLFDVGDLRDHFAHTAVPSPDFSRLAILSKYRHTTMKVSIVDLEKRVITDSIPFLTAPDDTTAENGYQITWESDTSLVVYGTGYDKRVKYFGYRVQGGELTDTIPDIVCASPKRTSSSPWSPDWMKVTMSMMGLEFAQEPPSGCLGYK